MSYRKNYFVTFLNINQSVIITVLIKYLNNKIIK